jgi:hypothetical protein
MTSATQLSPSEQNELLGEITTTLVDTAPEGWQRLIFDFMVVGRHANVAFAASMADGSMRQLSVPKDLSKLLSRLRKGMYAENLGTWFSLELIVDPPARYHARFNHDTEPAFRTPPAPEQFTLDQERFPRSDENLPEWFRSRL